MTSENELFNRWRSKLMVSLLEAFVFYALNQKTWFGGELVILCQKYVYPEAKVPTIYGILNRSSQFGLIYAKEEKTKDGVTRGTSRKYYDLTASGKIHLENMMDIIQSMHNVIQFDVNLLEVS